MDPSKSQAEFYLDLCTQLVASDPLGTTSHNSLQKDIETLRSRFHSEGLSFLTKTLPKLGKALDHGLANLSFKLPREFRHSHGNRSIPAFLQAYFKLIFSEDGSLLEEAPAEAVLHLRQILFFVYKLDLPYLPATEARVLQSFKEVDSELELVEWDKQADLLRFASLITKDVFSGFDPKDILPRHGPGAVATGERLEEKWVFSRLYDNIHQCYPYYDYFIVGKGNELLDRSRWYRSLKRLRSGVAKVVLVPKDSRGPRLISAEPLEYQWIQQGLGRKMAHHLEYVSTYTRGNVNFTSQEINRTLALANSVSRANCTMDLKDASDRVSLALVQSVFRDTPELLRALEACRSEATLLPTGEVVKLRKYAPMGSALCFPVEAYVFWVLLVAHAVRERRVPLEQAAASIYVYGDDLIVPTDWFDQCTQCLESVGLKVNRDKCCVTGPFRESCGMDAFNGTSVTPIRLKRQFSDLFSDGSVLQSYTDVANQLQQRGYTTAANLIWERLEATYGKLPYGTPLSSFPCKVVQRPEQAVIRNHKRFRSRWNPSFQRVEFYVPVVFSRRRRAELDDWPRLLKSQVIPGDDDPSSVVIPRSTKTKRGWRPVF